MKKLLIIIASTFLFISCKTGDKNESKIINPPIIEVQQKEQDRKLIPDVNRDDSQYDDAKTLEFALKDDKGRNLCLYHNIWKQKNINFENHEVFKDWSTEKQVRKWVKQEIDGLSVIWNYMNGTILIMETESPNWSTKRGIKVGDSISKAYEIYAPDADIYELNEDKTAFVNRYDNKNNLYILKLHDTRIYIYIANLLEEEIMNINFHHKDGIITKIEVFFSN